VLLAQQVSLLSQILLGQTMLGGPHAPGQAAAPNPVMSGVLQTLLPGLTQPGASLPSQQAPVAQTPPVCPPAPPPVEPEEQGALEPDASPPMRRRRPETKFSIPLFHVAGITKSQDPKKMDLVRTPESRRAWSASSAARKTRYETETSSPPKPSTMRLINVASPGKPLRIQDLHSFPPPSNDTVAEAAPPSDLPPRQHNAEQYAHHAGPASMAPAQKQSQHHGGPVMLPVTTTRPPLLKLPSMAVRGGAYVPRTPGPASFIKTKFPILQAEPASPPSAPHFAPPRSRAAWPDQNRPDVTLFERVREIPVVPPQRSALIPRLIDPREVLAYERNKQNFQSVKQVI